MRGSIIALCLFVLALGSARPCFAYNIGSGLTHPCHEKLTIPSTLAYLEENDSPISLPENDLWLRLYEQLFSDLALDSPSLGSELQTPQEKFLALSMILGARHPDTNGHSVFSTNSLRRVHSDANAQQQYVHCLRAADDDGPGADQLVLERTKSILEGKIEAFASARARSPSQQLRTLSLYWEHSGMIDVEVWEPGFILGEALHTLQDSYSHTIRTSDGRQVLSVLNFVEAAGGSLERSRDGRAHSRAMDQCRDEELSPLVEQVERVSIALTQAATAFAEGNPTRLNRGLSACNQETPDLDCGWLEYSDQCAEALAATGTLEGSCCTEAGRYCQTSWLDKISEAPTQPLLEDTLGCRFSPPPLISGSPSAPLAGLSLALLGLLRRKSSWRRRTITRKACPRARVHQTSLYCFLLLLPWPARAEEKPVSSKRRQLVVAAEVHGSLLSGAPHRGLMDITWGPQLRLGTRCVSSPESWRIGFFALVEHSIWVSTETRLHAEPAFFNLGVGIEALYWTSFRSSLAVGPSVLVQETAARSAPAAGFFLDIRPAGVRIALGRSLRMTIDPLTATWVAAALGHPSVSTLHYRLVVGLEWQQPSVH